MRHLVETVERRSKTFEIFCRAGRRQGAERASVKRAFEGDEAIALGVTFRGVITARDLDRAARPPSPPAASTVAAKTEPLAVEET